MHSARLTTPARQLSLLLRHVRRELTEFGDYELISGLLKRVLTDGNGAMRQRRALARGATAQNLVNLAVRRTTADSQPADRLAMVKQ